MEAGRAASAAAAGAAESTEVLVSTGWGGLALAACAGIGLVVLVLLLRRGLKKDVGAAEIVFGLVPLGLWLVLGGHVSRFAFAGVELEASDAIVRASRAPVEEQVTEIEGDVTPFSEIVHEVETVRREAKGATGAIPSLIAGRVEALEFRLGQGGFYVGSAVREYLTQLSAHPFFRYVVIFDERGGLFGLFDQRDLMAHLRTLTRDERRVEPDGFEWFASALNSSSTEARADLAAIPGFVPGELAITPRTPKREALEAMERHGVALLPAVRLDRGFVGVVQRDRLTASLILDVARALESRR